MLGFLRLWPGLEMRPGKYRVAKNWRGRWCVQEQFVRRNGPVWRTAYGIAVPRDLIEQAAAWNRQKPYTLPYDPDNEWNDPPNHVR